MAKTQITLNKLRRFMLWISLVFFLVLLSLSIVGACWGSKRAGELFNSNPLIIFWLLFLVLLIAGVLTFKRLQRQPGLLMIHLGCVLILLGAMWSSEKGHSVQKKLLGIDKIPRGYLIIDEGARSHIVQGEDPNQIRGHLPFFVWLEDFWIEYYWPDGVLHVKNHQGQTWRTIARVGEELELSAPLRKAKILRVLTNLKVADRVTDKPQDRINPALVVEVEFSDGQKRAAYAFPPQMPHLMQMEDYEFVYDPNMLIQPKDYYSDLVVLDYVNKVQKRQVIEVNKPLHYNGYHFYQSSFGPSSPFASRQWTVLGVVSDSGFSVVFTGYILLGIGIFWHCWLRHISSYFKKRN